MRECVEREVMLDVGRSGVQKRICARQGDSLVHRFNISLYHMGRRLSLENVVQARVIGERSDGSVVYGECARDGAKFVFTPGSGFFELGGAVVCRLVVRGGDGAELYSPIFVIEAESVAGFSGTEALERSEISKILSDAIAARDMSAQYADKAKEYATSTPILLSEIVFDDPSDGESAFGLDLSGSASVSVESPRILRVSFDAPLRRVIVTSRTPELGERVTGVNLEMRLNGGDTMCGVINGFHTYYAGYRFGAMSVDLLRPWDSFSCTANIETGSTFTKSCIIGINEKLAGVEKIDCITLTCTEKLESFPPFGTIKVYGEYA